MGFREEQGDLLHLTADGLHSLYDSGRSGNWGDVRSTAMAVITLVDCLEDPESRWVQEPALWLSSMSRKEGPKLRSWESEVWDTALATIALTRAKVSRGDKRIQESVDWIVSVRNSDFNWHHELWETALALLAILETESYGNHSDLDKSIQWIIHVTEAAGHLIPHYSAFLALVLRAVRERELSLGNVEVRKKAEELAHHNMCHFLTSGSDHRPWTEEAWSNGYILMAYFPCGHISLIGNPAIDAIIAWFHDAVNRDGGWADVEDTCNAIRGLKSLYLEREYEHAVGAAKDSPQPRVERTAFIRRENARLRDYLRQHVKKGSIHSRLISRDIDGGTTVYLSKSLKKRLAVGVTVILTVSGLIAFGGQLWEMVKAVLQISVE